MKVIPKDWVFRLGGDLYFSRLIKCYEIPIKTGYDIISIVIREIIENQSNKYWHIRINYKK